MNWTVTAGRAWRIFETYTRKMPRHGGWRPDFLPEYLLALLLESRNVGRQLDVHSPGSFYERFAQRLIHIQHGAIESLLVDADRLSHSRGSTLCKESHDCLVERPAHLRACVETLGTHGLEPRNPVRIA